MTQMGEVITVPDADETFPCPFEHEKKEIGNKRNTLPSPKEANNSSTLKTNLGGPKKTNINVNKEPCDVLYTAHHLIPGNEAWPKTQLYGWVDKRKSDYGILSKVNADVGYDVNDGQNGIYLGDDEYVPAAAKKGVSKTDYAYRFMEEKKCQWHDRHEPCSEFVVNQLNKIAERLDNFTSSLKGCGESNCGGAKKKKDDKVDPPYSILNRVHAVEKRLKAYLSSEPDAWVLPLVTSKYVVAFREKIKLDAAKARLDALKSQYVGGR
jgi:hypothetical protein